MSDLNKHIIFGLIALSEWVQSGVLIKIVVAGWYHMIQNFIRKKIMCAHNQADIVLCKGEVVLHKKFICKNLTVLQYKIYKTENAVIANRQTIYIKKTKKGQRLGIYVIF